MVDIVNWKLLEANLQKFKKADFEPIHPDDRNFLDSDTSAVPDSSSFEPAGPHIPDSYTTRLHSIEQEESEEPASFIEVENAKGKIKQIDPDDYIVTFCSLDNKILYSGSLNFIGKGLYSSIAKQHGADQALVCVLKDFAKNPEIISPKLNVIQAKMILTSMMDENGFVEDRTVSNVLSRMATDNKNTISAWLKSKHCTKK